MSTPAQIKANRQNGGKSKGPATPEGKAVSSANAWKHGLLCRDVVGPAEDPAAFEALQERLHAELKPVGQLEEDLVSRIAAQAWRLRRVERIEAGLCTWLYYDVLATRVKEKAKTFTEDLDNLEPTVLVTNRKRYQAATVEQRKHEAMQQSETATLGAAFIEDASKVNAFSKLARYEAAIERSLHRNLHELQRLQAARQGQPVAPPVAVDIDIDISADNRTLGRALEEGAADSEENDVTNAD